MPLASLESDPSTSKRQAPRTHLFVIATLYCDGGSAPVHIRNLSGQGGLVEAAALPPPGSKILLKRGRLEVRGRIAWKSTRQAGIAFESTVDVADWMARQVSPHQERVDRLMSDVRSSISREMDNEAGCSTSLREELAELSALRSDLTRLGEGLTADIILVATHPELQLLDIALQRVDRIVARLEELSPAMSSPAVPATAGHREG